MNIGTWEVSHGHLTAIVRSRLERQRLSVGWILCRGPVKQNCSDVCTLYGRAVNICTSRVSVFHCYFDVFIVYWSIVDTRCWSTYMVTFPRKKNVNLDLSWISKVLVSLMRPVNTGHYPAYYCRAKGQNIGEGHCRRQTGNTGHYNGQKDRLINIITLFYSNTHHSAGISFPLDVGACPSWIIYEFMILDWLISWLIHDSVKEMLLSCPLGHNSSVLLLVSH